MLHGAPAHFALHVRALLYKDFTGRWTGRGGPRELLQPSPDLIARDFFLFFSDLGAKGILPVKTKSTLRTGTTNSKYFCRCSS